MQKAIQIMTPVTEQSINITELKLKLSHKLLIISFFCLFALLQSTSLWASVDATTNRTSLSIDETMVLEIVSENNSGEPDLSELEDDFQIMGKSQSQNYSLINGHASRTHSWNITLLPKKTGKLTIPAIKIGSESTQPIKLVIEKESTTPAIDGKEVFLKIQIAKDEIDETTEKKSYYVQQQIIITVKLFHRIRFSNASLSDLELSNTVVEKLGNDANYSKVIANHRYNIIERRYAVFPQQSGELIIPAMTFTGNAEISQNFSLFSRPGRQIVSRTKPIALNILPIPANYTGKNWLPAESLEIESEIVEAINTISAGEAITQHIVVRAKGLLGSQLPVISVALNKTIKTYPDKEKLSNQLINGQVLGVRRDTVAIIPLKAGEFTLPEIKVDWWNTQTNQQETAYLAPQTLIAKANPDSPELNAKAPVKEPVNTQANNTSEAHNPEQTETTKTIEKLVYKDLSLMENIWFWISLALLILWFITFIILISSRAKNKQAELNSQERTQAQNVAHKALGKYLQAIYQACQANNASQASHALIQWARLHFKQTTLAGLSDIIQTIDDEHFINAINQLESVQYSKNKQNWDGNALKTALESYLAQEKRNHQEKKQKPQAFAHLNP
ncbi:BatD family protein [sulfur-oxidizing endosymbiont of Gigantopelta aegis]|uniref:BatD family protein n=1 Tax=sulfur-oxidizing endosymbiont of Gigantopelta aegis TaxID=2794934 RepID=UPI0018DDF883|nr:BatD family protein [sulfur-oxidizing endosymbiont of Gigantopelta aegis]